MIFAETISWTQVAAMLITSMVTIVTTLAAVVTLWLNVRAKLAENKAVAVAAATEVKEALVASDKEAAVKFKETEANVEEVRHLANGLNAKLLAVTEVAGKDRGAIEERQRADAEKIQRIEAKQEQASVDRQAEKELKEAIVEVPQKVVDKLNGDKP